MDEFSQRLREALRGHRILDVCASAGCCRRSMVGWLNGSHQPTAIVVYGLCRALGVSADWLLGLSDERTAA